MPMPEVSIEEDEVVIHFETSDLIDIRLFSSLMIEVVNLAQREEHFGPLAQVRFAELRTGSLTAKIKVLGAQAKEWSGLGSFVLALFAAFQSPELPPGQICAAIMADHKVEYVLIRSRDKECVVERDNAALRALLDTRNPSATDGEPPALSNTDETDFGEIFHRGLPEGTQLNVPRLWRTWTGVINSDQSGKLVFQTDDGSFVLAGIKGEEIIIDRPVQVTGIAFRPKDDGELRKISVHSLFYPD